MNIYTWCKKENLVPSPAPEISKYLSVKRSVNMADELEIILEPTSGKYSQNDSRWTSEVTELVTNCQRRVGKVSKRYLPQEGKKSGLETLILALGTSGAIPALVDIFKAWLSRDRTRGIKIKILTKEGAVEEYEITGTGMDKKVIEDHLTALLQSREK